MFLRGSNTFIRKIFKDQYLENKVLGIVLSAGGISVVVVFIFFIIANFIIQFCLVARENIFALLPAWGNSNAYKVDHGR